MWYEDQRAVDAHMVQFRMMVEFIPDGVMGAREGAPGELIDTLDDIAHRATILRNLIAPKTKPPTIAERRPDTPIDNIP